MFGASARDVGTLPDRQKWAYAAMKVSKSLAGLRFGKKADGPSTFVCNTAHIEVLLGLESNRDVVSQSHPCSWVSVCRPRFWESCTSGQIPAMASCQNADCLVYHSSGPVVSPQLQACLHLNSHPPVVTHQG